MAIMVAYILIRSQSGKETELVDEIKKIPQVTDCHVIYGEWDIITRVEYEKIPELNTLVLQIRALPGVQQTSTLVVA
ncbi:MAG: Lrp/AsnC ligand binding domain-containing protein [Candidatus Odinarchaeia archaeon]